MPNATPACMVGDGCMDLIVGVPQDTLLSQAFRPQTAPRFVGLWFRRALAIFTLKTSIIQVEHIDGT